MLRIVSTLSIVISSVFRTPVRDEQQKEDEDDASEQVSTPDENFSLLFKGREWLNFLSR